MYASLPFRKVSIKARRQLAKNIGLLCRIESGSGASKSHFEFAPASIHIQLGKNKNRSSLLT